MTLPDVVPSLRGSSTPHPAQELWPATAVHTGSDLEIGGVALSNLARDCTTPCYVIDEVDVRRRCRELRTAFGASTVSYSARALNSQRVLRWIAEEGLGVTVCSAGEIASVRAAGFAPGSVTSSGPKTPDDLRAALDYPVGRIVIDSPSEIRRLAAHTSRPQQVLLRVYLGTPGADRAGTPAALDEQRLGLTFAGGEVDKMVASIIRQPQLQLVGLDCSIDSPGPRFDSYERSLRQLIDLLCHLNSWYGLQLTDIQLSDGCISARPADEYGTPIDAFARHCADIMQIECDRLDMPVPRLTVSAGRDVVARAGVALYRLLEVRRDPHGHQLVTIDGGFADNPRPALYGARYTPILIGRASAAVDQPTTVVGRFGVAGDVIARNVPLPGDLRPGDVVAVAGCGAYHHAMASNYALVPRPPIVAVRGGVAQLMVRAETVADLLARDVEG